MCSTLAALTGRQIGRSEKNTENARNERLRKPLEENSAWLHSRLKDVVESAQADGEISKQLDAAELAATLVAAIQGWFVVASAQESQEPLHRAMRGVLSLSLSESDKQ